MPKTTTNKAAQKVPSPEKITALRGSIARLNSAVLAFSGGVDSALLAAIAAEELGDNFIAATLRSPLMKESDVAESVQFCKTYNISHVLLDMDILGNVKFAANDHDRCYYCKEQIFAALKQLADQRGYKHLMDGTNIEDCPKRRPGMRVLTEMSVVSPLRENGFTKADIRALSKEMGLFTWDKVSDSCLATRIPQGESITMDRLRQMQYRAN